MTNLKDAGAMTLRLDAMSDNTAIIRQDGVYRRRATNILAAINTNRCVLRCLHPQGPGVIANFRGLASCKVNHQLLDEYADDGLAAQKEALIHMDNDQLDDAKKGVRVIVDVLTQGSVGSEREIPMRLVLGGDEMQTIRNKDQLFDAVLKE
ncbi:estradiol 17-beta-dehydrogenase [Xylaria castorea]|nr:estradiol 17-beta-dehydrogenase [Xylaria castorea]